MRSTRLAGTAAAVATAGLLSVGGMALASAASAAPADTCPSTQPGYGSGQCSARIDGTEFVADGTIFFSGGTFFPAESGTVILHSTAVVAGSFTANANGQVSGSVKIPAGFPAGQHTLELKGNLGTDLTVGFTVAAAGGSSSSSGSSGSTLPFTGADVAGLAAGGAGLVVGGGLLTVAFRRRRGTAA